MENKIPRKSGEWIMIIKDIPVEDKVKPKPLSIYYAFPTKLFFSDSFKYHDYDEIRIANALGIRRGDSLKAFCDAYYRGKMKDEKLSASAHAALENADPQWQMKIKTKGGDVCIQPYEYTFVDDLNKWIEPVKDGHAFIRYLNEKETIKKGKVADQIFYLRSRGIGFADAVMMISGNIKTQNLFYIEFHDEYVNHFFR